MVEGLSLQLLVAFTTASVLLFLTPGPSMTLILATGAAHGTRAGVAAVLGNAVGYVLMLSLVLGGLQVIVSSFTSWFPVVRLVGAGYLFWLGVSHFLKSRREVAAQHALPDPPGKGRYAVSGVIAAIANPAAIAFLAAFLPQFIDPARAALPQFTLLAVIFIAVSVGVQSLLAFLADRVSHWFLGSRAALIDRIAAIVLMAGGFLLLFPRG